MNRRQLGFGIATAAMTAAAAAVAQQAAPLVQMAPPRPNTRWSAAFESQISRLPETIQGEVRTFYDINGWRPVWTAERLRGLNAAAGRAERHGLPASDFFDFVGYAADPDSADVRTTAAALSYARVLAEGRVRPEDVEDLWEMQKNRVDLPTGLNDALAQNRLLDWFEGLAPTDIGYTNLSAGYVRYRRLSASGGWPAFRQGGTIEPGASDSRIQPLIKRLVAEGDLSAEAGARLASAGNVYSSEIEAGVRSFS